MSHEENQLDVNLENESIATKKSIDSELEVTGRWNMEPFYSFVSGVFILILVGYCLWWLYATFWSYPRSKDLYPTERIASAVVAGVNTTFPLASARVEYLQGGNVDVFIARSDFEATPFPDREKDFERMSGYWARKVNHTHCPTFRLRDIRTGETLAYNCPKLHRFGVADIK